MLFPFSPLTSSCTVCYHIPNKRLYFSLSYHVNYNIMAYVFQKFVNHFFHFYFFNMDILLNIHLRVLQFCIDNENIHLEGSMSQIFYFGLNPIFHCDAKYLASWVGVGHCTRRQNFALPNAKYSNMLVYFALDDAYFSRHPTQNPNASQSNIGCVGSQTQISCVGHVHFFLFL